MAHSTPDPLASDLAEARHSHARISEQRVTLAGMSIQGGLVAFCATGAATLAAAAAPLSLSVALFAMLGGWRLWITRRANPPAWMIYTSIAADFVLFYLVILAFHWRPGGDPQLTLEAPTFIFVFVLIALRALRFNVREMIFAGVVAAAGWSAVTTLALASAGAHSANVNMAREILILLERIVAMACVCGVICIASTRGARYLARAHAATARTTAALERETALNAQLVRQTQETAAANERLQRANTALQTANTELASTQHALHDALVHAQAATRAKARFLSNMSHELRTPLNAMIGFSSILESETHGPLGAPEYADYVATISASGQHMLEIVVAVLEFAALSEAEVKAQAAHIEIDALMAAAMETQSRLAANRDVAVVCEPSAAGVSVTVDVARAERALAALIKNAVQFSAPGGVVRLSRTMEERDISIRVADDGPGMDAETLARVVKPFEKGDMSDTAAHGGIGLGLTMAKTVAEAHGGTLHLNSTPGGGTTATIRFARDVTRVTPQAIDAAA